MKRSWSGGGIHYSIERSVTEKLERREYIKYIIMLLWAMCLLMLLLLVCSPAH